MPQEFQGRSPVGSLNLHPLRGRPKIPTTLFLRVLRRLINSTTITQWPNLACSHVRLLVSSVLPVFDKFPISATDIISALEVKIFGM